MISCISTNNKTKVNNSKIESFTIEDNVNNITINDADMITMNKIFIYLNSLNRNIICTFNNCNIGNSFIRLRNDLTFNSCNIQDLKFTIIDMIYDDIILNVTNCNIEKISIISNVINNNIIVTMYNNIFSDKTCGFLCPNELIYNNSIKFITDNEKYINNNIHESKKSIVYYQLINWKYTTIIEIAKYVWVRYIESSKRATREMIERFIGEYYNFEIYKLVTNNQLSETVIRCECATNISNEFINKYEFLKNYINYSINDIISMVAEYKHYICTYTKYSKRQ